MSAGIMIGRKLFLFCLLLASCSKPALFSAQNAYPQLKGFQGQVVFVSATADTGSVVFISENQILTTMPAYGDCRLRFSESENKLYVIQRFNSDSYYTVDLNQGLKETEHSLMREKNLQDIYPLGENQAWVTAYDTSEVSLLDLKTNNVLQKLELEESRWDKDKRSEPTYIAHSSTHFAVPFQRLSNFIEPNDSFLLTWPKEKNEPTWQVLHYQNPVTRIKSALGKFWIGSAGVIQNGTRLDGGIETLLTSDFMLGEKIIGEEILGGDIVDFVIAKENLGFAIVSDTQTWVVAFNPSNGKRIEEIEPIRTNGFYFPQIHFREKEKDLLLLDQDPKKPGLRFFDLDLKEKTSNTVSLPLPPVDRLVIE